MNSVRPEVRKENPEATIGEIAKIMGKMWGEIDADKKAKFDKDAAAAKKKWEVEKAAYEKKPKPAESETEEEERSALGQLRGHGRQGKVGSVRVGQAKLGGPCVMPAKQPLKDCNQQKGGFKIFSDENGGAEGGASGAGVAPHSELPL